MHGIILPRSAMSSGKPIELIGTTSGRVTTSNITLSVPAGAQDGDLLIACIITAGAQTITVPSGWTKWAERTSSCAGMVAYLPISGTPPSTVTFTGSAATAKFGALILIRAAQIDAISSFSTGNAANEFVNAASLTSSGGQSFAMGGAASGPYTPGDVTAMTSLVKNSANSPAFGLYHRADQPAGATGAKSIPLPGSGDIQKCAIAFCVKPMG